MLCPEFDNNNQGQSDTHCMTGLDNEQPPDGRYAGEWQPLEHGLSDWKGLGEAVSRCPFKKANGSKTLLAFSAHARPFFDPAVILCSINWYSGHALYPPTFVCVYVYV